MSFGYLKYSTYICTKIIDEMEEIRRKIKANGISNNYIAKVLNVHYATVSNWITGTRPIPENKLKELKDLIKRLEELV